MTVVATVPATRGTRPPVTHLIVGPEDHGVVIFARWLAEHTGGDIVHVPEPDAFEARALTAAASVHLHYTEALYGPDTTRASAAFGRLRAALPFPVSVTLHDLPDPSDDPARYARRAAGFAAVVEAVEQVCVSSRHELALLHGFARPDRAHVIPLPMAADPVVAEAERPQALAEVAVFGFLYPGKGHEELLDDLNGLPGSLGLTAIGRAADGHPALARELTERAAQAGRIFSVTGFLPAHQLLPRLRRTAVPVVPATRISASGSLNTWIEAGRRPLVAEGAYTRELAQTWPEAVTLYRPGAFAAAARRVLDDPSLTWLREAPPAGLQKQTVAQAYLGMFEENR